MFDHMALEPRCGALRPGALQLGGAQTGYHTSRGIFKCQGFTEMLIGVAIDEAHRITQW